MAKPKRQKYLGVRIPPPLYEDIEALRKRRDAQRSEGAPALTVTSVVEWLLREGVERHRGMR